MRSEGAAALHVRVSRVIIRPALESDITPALAAMSAAFDLPLRAPTVHTLVAGSSSGVLLVADDGGTMLGTAGSVGFGPTGWLGGVTVIPEARGSGLGRRLTEAAIDALGERETVLLLASALGRPVYEKLGFVAEEEYRVFIVDESSAAAPGGIAAAAAGAPPAALGEGSTGSAGASSTALDEAGAGMGSASSTALGEGGASMAGASSTALGEGDAAVAGAPPAARLFPSADPALVRTLDRRATGEDRSLVLDASRAYACRDAVALVPPWPALAVIGGPDGAEELVRGLVRPGMRIAAPASNLPAVALMAALGSERAPVVRMRRGPAVAWRPSEVWGVFSLFFG